MGKLGIAAFTEVGRQLGKDVAAKLKNSYEICWYEQNLKEWCKTCFEQADAILFIGACGIAVRSIAPLIQHKTKDPAVLVMDENANHVISLLSGHIGGANELAVQIGTLTGADPVITTASDVRGKIAVDVFAKKNDLIISDIKAAGKIAAAILRGERVDLYCSGNVEGDCPPELHLISDRDEAEKSDASYLIWISEYLPFAGEASSETEKTILHLIPRCVQIGIGCRKGKPKEEIETVICRAAAQIGISLKSAAAAASIDLKKEEEGILGVCGEWEIPFTVFSAEELQKIEGSFTPSSFVAKTTGVDNVCERSSLALCGSNGRLIGKKYAENGVTAAFAEKEWRIRFEK